MTADPFQEATVAAIEDVHAALSSTDQTDVATGEAQPVAQPAPPSAAAVLGAGAGHGTIRLRGQAAGLSTTDPATAPELDPAAADDLVGHGKIRLRAQTPPPERAADDDDRAPEPAAAADHVDSAPEPAAAALPVSPGPGPPAPTGPAAHGPIRLHDRAGPAHPTAGDPVGHGTIRLRDPREAAAAEPVGHGTIHLHGRTPPPDPGLLHVSAEATEPADPVTEAAREDILAAIAATA